MLTNKPVILILAGGKSTRMQSIDSSLPNKLLYDIGIGNSLVENTMNYIKDIFDLDQRFIVTTRALYELIRARIGALLLCEHYIIEPNSRNTALCILLSVLTLHKTLGDVLVYITPSDLIFTDANAVMDAIRTISSIAVKTEELYCIASKNGSFDSSCSYLQIQDNTEVIANHPYDVKKFYLQNQEDIPRNAGLFKNTGIYISRLSNLLYFYKHAMPNEMSALQNALAYTNNSDSYIKDIYLNSVSHSFESKIVINNPHFKVLPLDFDFYNINSPRDIENYKALLS